jgi:two-component system, sensor histidine kinase and response regulator
MAQKNTILIIDDEEVMRDGCQMILSKAGHIAETAENGTIGLEKMRILKPDAVLVDLKMPGISGLDVLEKIPEIDPNMIAIVITGYATIESAVDAMKKGAFDFLPKPFTPDELRLIINRGLERRHLILETERLREEKRRIEENFITMVTHQLRSPLTTVQQYFEVILAGLTGDVPEKQKEMLLRAKGKLQNLLNLINDWLNMARISHEQLVEKFKPVDISLMIYELVQFMKPAAKEKNIDLDFELPSDLPKINADPESLEQVFTNLINNAIIYNRPNGKVTIRIREEDGFVAIDISDTGIGIAEKDIPFLFDQFYRVKREETQNIKGTGLGLPIAKKIVEAHNGSIRIFSILNQGTTFTILLPK